MSPAALARTGGRILLVDQQQCLLLIHERTDDGRTHWLTPGGGVEAGETPAQAAVRELYEETGIVAQLPPGATPLIVTRRAWTWEGVSYDQLDYFYAVRTAQRPPVHPSGLTAMERETLLGHDWWAVDALRASGETFVPATPVDMLERAGQALRATA